MDEATKFAMNCLRPIPQPINTNLFGITGRVGRWRDELMMDDGLQEKCCRCGGVNWADKANMATSCIK